jgi:uncharacterized protein (TIGR00369 family)
MVVLHVHPARRRRPNDLEQPMDPLARKWIDGVVLGSPVAKAIGATLVSAEVDAVTVDLPFDENLTTMPGLTHGGVLATLIDIAGAAASATGVRAEDGATGGATSHLAVTYLSPGRGDLRAVATVIHRTRSATNADVQVSDASGRLVASGQVSSRILH